MEGGGGGSVFGVGRQTHSREGRQEGHRPFFSPVWSVYFHLHNSNLEALLSLLLAGGIAPWPFWSPWEYSV